MEGGEQAGERVTKETWWPSQLGKRDQGFLDVTRTLPRERLPTEKDFESGFPFGVGFP